MKIHAQMVRHIKYSSGAVSKSHSQFHANEYGILHDTGFYEWQTIKLNSVHLKHIKLCGGEVRHLNHDGIREALDGKTMENG